MRRVHPVVRIGPPVDLSPWRGREIDGPTLRAATEAVMDTLAAMTGLTRTSTDARTVRLERARGAGDGPDQPTGTR
jgi:1-acyl-sn-glycerol-3-phosphate acyltransferase